MRNRKLLGFGAGGRELKSFNVKLRVNYKTTFGETIDKEAVFQIISTDRPTATSLAIEKAKKQLGEFSYICKNTVVVEKWKREKKCTK